MVIFHGYVRKNQRVSDESRSSWALALPQSPWRSWEGLDNHHENVANQISVQNNIIMIYAIDNYIISLYI